MDVFLFAANAVLPILLLILLGYFLRQKGILSPDFLKTGNDLVFRICLPCMLFSSVYSIGSLEQISWSAVLFALAAALVIWLVGIPLVKRFVPDPKRKGVVLQSMFRSNFSLIGLPFAESLGGIAGMGMAAVLSAFMIPAFNVMAVISLTMFVDAGKKHDWKGVFKKILTNPLIISTLLGLLVLLIRQWIPRDDAGALVFSLEKSLPFLYKTIKNLSAVASPLALIVLGGRFSFGAVKGMRRELAIGVTARIVAVPAAAVGCAILLSNLGIVRFDSSVYPAFIALFGTPAAVSSAIMAQQMDNDGALAGQLVAWTSFLSMFTIFFFVVVLRGAGYL